MAKMKREVKVGIFAVVTLAALYWGINFLRGRDIFNRDNVYYATYDQVNGIQKSSAIVIKGFKVGVISDIEYDPVRYDRVVLEFSIRSKYKIPENSKARIYSDGLMGGKAVEIVLGDAECYLEKGDTLRSEMDKDFLEVAGSELEFFKQKAGDLMTNLTATLTNINSILAENSASINSTLTNLSQITGTLNGVVQSEQGGLREIVRNMNALSATLEQNSGRIDNIIGNVEGFTDSLRSSDIPGMVGNLSATLGQFNTTLAGVNSNQGSLGKLLNDDALYDSLVTASGNLAGLLEDVKAHPGRYVNISVFGKRDK